MIVIDHAEVEAKFEQEKAAQLDDAQAKSNAAGRKLLDGIFAGMRRLGKDQGPEEASRDMSSAGLETQPTEVDSPAAASKVMKGKFAGVTELR